MKFVFRFCLVVGSLNLAGCSASPDLKSPTANARGTGSTAGGTTTGGNSDGTTSNGTTPSVPGSTPPSQSVICASLASDADVTLGCPNPRAGLKGDIYVIEDGYSGPEIQISYVMNHGVKLTQQIQMTNFNVPTRNFTEGFPLADGTLLSGPSGRPITEWFAFDLQGYLTLKAPYASGPYEFAFFIDDGAILNIDGNEVLNADGYHSPQWKCQTGSVNLTVDELHPLSLKYFQGPATQIALRMMIRPYSAGAPCNENGGFVPLPEGFISN